MNRQELLEVAYDNQRDHQIGGHQDGISEEVARDLGFTLPHEVGDLVITETEPKVASVAPVAETGSQIPGRETDWRLSEEAKQIGRLGVSSARSAVRAGIRIRH